MPSMKNGGRQKKSSGDARLKPHTPDEQHGRPPAVQGSCNASFASGVVTSTMQAMDPTSDLPAMVTLPSQWAPILVRWIVPGIGS